MAIAVRVWTLLSEAKPLSYVNNAVDELAARKAFTRYHADHVATGVTYLQSLLFALCCRTVVCPNCLYSVLSVTLVYCGQKFHGSRCHLVRS